MSLSICKNMKVLVVTAVTAEKEALLQGLGNKSNFTVITAGVGAVQAAVNTTEALFKADYDLVISTGIAGGFINKANIGDIVVATNVIAADFGFETLTSFSFIDELGFGTAKLTCDELVTTALLDALKAAYSTIIKSGTILTVNTVTGTKDTALTMCERIPDAAAECMEGFGIGIAALNKNIRFSEIRTISNFVGPRDRNNWKIKDALYSLTKLGAILAEVF